MENFSNFRILGVILHNEFKPFRKLVYEEGNVRTYKILGLLEILEIKNKSKLKWGKVSGVLGDYNNDMR